MTRLIPALAVLLAGCAIQPHPQYVANVEEIRRTVPICTSEAQCAARWEAAQVWVARNAGYRIQTATNAVIQTYGASGGRTELAAQVIKEPVGNGVYRIVAKVWCDGYIGCRPDTVQALLDFNRTVGSVQ